LNPGKAVFHLEVRIEAICPIEGLAMMGDDQHLSTFNVISRWKKKHPLPICRAFCIT
jgi:hypothetical protein